MAKRLKYRLGAVAPPIADIALAASLATPSRYYETALPSCVDLTQHLGPQWDQGKGNTCVAHAMAGLHAWKSRRDGKNVIASRWEIYARSKQDDGLSPCGGTSLAAASRVLAKGVTSEACTPYPAYTGPCDYAYPPEVKIQARRCKLDTAPLPRLSASTTGLEVGAVKMALANGSPVAVGMTVFSLCQSEAWFPIGLFAELPEDRPIGGHAVLLVGYQDDHDAPGGGWLMVRNSWLGWAEKSPFASGVGMVSYQYVGAHAFEGRSLADSSPIAPTHNPDPVVCPNPYGGGIADMIVNLPSIYS